MKLYNDYFELDKGYSDNKWQKTFPHSTFINLLEKTERLLDRSENYHKKPLWIEGAYGTGKSRIVWTLKNLLTCTEQEFNDYFDTYKGLQEKNDLRNKLLGHKKGKIIVAYRYGSSDIENNDALITSIYTSINNAIESENLTDNERTVANTYYLLADYYVQLGDSAAQQNNDKDDGFGWAKTNVSYNQLWENLYAIVEDSETVSEKAGGGDYAAAMYRETANQIASNISHFRSDGVSMNEIRNAIDEGRAYISNLQETNTNGSLIEQTTQALDSAERTYESYMNISAGTAS